MEIEELDFRSSCSWIEIESGQVEKERQGRMERRMEIEDEYPGEVGPRIELEGEGD